METEKVHVSKITVGNTVIHNGEMRTVCRRAFSRDDFVGLMLWGDSYNMGRILIERVLFPCFYAGRRVD